MSDSQDKVPVWVGRAVTPTDAGSDVDGSEMDGLLVDDTRRQEASAQSVDADPLEIPIKPVAFTIDSVDVDDDDFDSSRYGSSSSTDEGLGIAPRHDIPRRSPFGLLVAVLAVVLIAMAAVAFLAGWLNEGSSTDSSESTEEQSANGQAVDDTQTPDASSNGDSSPSSGGSEGAAGPSTESDAGPTSTTGSTAAAGDSSFKLSIPGMPESSIEAHRLEAQAAGEWAWAIYTQGKIFLQGKVPSEAVGQQFSRRLESLLGAGNVVEQFEIDPSVGEPVDPPLFIKETVVFAPNETTMPPGSDWILVVADVLMKRYSNTTLTVIANSNTPVDPGDDSDLPDRRAQTIIAYLVDGGIESDRLNYELRGDVGFGPGTGNEPIEFAVWGLLE